MTLPIVERLRREDHRESRFVNREPTVTLRNPDGPEAADLIDRLVEAASKFTSFAHRAGPATDIYWAACERLEEILASIGRAE
jgi:hypothetical protein